MTLYPRRLFGRAVLTLVFTFGLFAVVTFSAIVYYALMPVTQRSANDLAAFMVWSAQAWVMLPPAQRAAYSEKLLADHRIRIEALDKPIPETNYFLPYVLRVEQALEQHLGFHVPVRTRMEHGKRWFYADLNIAGVDLRVGFPRDRIATRPLTGAVVVLTSSLVLVLVTAAILARRITSPLTRLSEAAEQLGQGRSPQPLPETGPKELASLAHQFNSMARQVQELLDNRTILLAGISHDLRTPMTRVHLELAMLPRDTDPDLLGRMERDLEQMEELIEQALELGRNLGHGETTDVDVADLIEGLAADQPRIRFEPSPPCRRRLNAVALRRILVNLLENALRYSSEQPVDVRLDTAAEPALVRVLDRGPGIPDQEKEAVFRPFYRLEQSRNRETGGSGLGLAVARQLAEANGFVIRLADRDGGGTEAAVVLPRGEGDKTGIL
jgi:two-component system osmolarity sensor histidine kinase EnvZ